VIYASASKLGQHRSHAPQPDMRAMYEAILHHVPAPAAGRAAAVQISTLDYNSYVGRISIGRIRREHDQGRRTIQSGTAPKIMAPRVQQVLTFGSDA
jgi:GTP-binding protein